MTDREPPADFWTDPANVRKIIDKMNAKRERAHDLSGVHYPPDGDCRMAAWAMDALLAENEARMDALTRATFRADMAEALLCPEVKAAMEDCVDALTHALYLLPQDANQRKGMQGALRRARAALAAIQKGKG